MNLLLISRHAPFRDSKLTHILKPSLGGNALAAIICTVTMVVFEETDSTLRVRYYYILQCTLVFANEAF